MALSNDLAGERFWDVGLAEIQEANVEQGIAKVLEESRL